LVAVKADWSRRFVLGLRKLRDVIADPVIDHAAEWPALILIATSGGPTMFARIGIMRALNREFNPSRKDPHRGRRKLKRPTFIPL
jgi:hypothetical protein